MSSNVNRLWLESHLTAKDLSANFCFCLFTSANSNFNLVFGRKYRWHIFYREISPKEHLFRIQSIRVKCLFLSHLNWCLTSFCWYWLLMDRLTVLTEMSYHIILFYVTDHNLRLRSQLQDSVSKLHVYWTIFRWISEIKLLHLGNYL